MRENHEETFSHPSQIPVSAEQVRSGRWVIIIELPGLKPFFAFQRPDVGNILSHFQRAAISTVFISHSKVLDMDKFTLHLYPEFRLITLPGTEIVYDLLHPVEALGWMAVLNLPADDCRGAGEYPVFGF